VKIRVSNITKKFGKIIAVSNCSFEINDGEFFVLLGPSGAGKTTILDIIAGLERPNNGEIYFGEELVSSPFKVIEPRKRKIGMIFQDLALWPHMTVYQNIEFGLKERKYSKEERNKKIFNILELTKLLSYKSSYPTQLSTGEKQRVAIARAIVLDPDILLVDEPLSNLDEKLADELRLEIQKLQRQFKITTLYVTHNQREAFDIADKLIIINQGKIEQIGNPEDIYNKPKSLFVAQFIGQSNILKGNVTSDGIETEIGKLPYNPPIKEDSIIILIRPEDFEVSNDGSIVGIVVGRRFLSGEYYYELLINNNKIIVKSDETFSLHEKVRLKVKKSPYIFNN